jgi:hypothetical protein
MRFTVVDARGTVSFIAHSSVAVALTAACVDNPRSLPELLEASRKYDKILRDLVVNGLAVFDEHNVPGDTHAIQDQLRTLKGKDTPVFRVLDDVTREASLQPVRAGIVLFNLVRKRIVQIENTYEPLARSGAVNYHNGRFLSRRVFDYELPADWSIVP